MTPVYSIAIPTFRRGESLAECLESVCALDYPKDALEIVIVDNGGVEHTRAAADPFTSRLNIRYFINAKNRGYGFSVNRSIVESTGDRILLLNDDVRPMPDLLARCDALLATDPAIGCVGCRAIEKGYQNWGTDVGRLLDNGVILGNFDVDCGSPIEVEHIYGFCYVFTREAVRRTGLNDTTLLAQPYSSGNCIETDHCLSIREAGLKVVYHPGMVGVHLAKPRPDMSEVSLRWHLNAIRNPLYVYLKHFGPFGKHGAALRWTFTRHLGFVSMITRPNRANVSYFFNGARAKSSAWWHWIKYLMRPRREDPETAFRKVLDADAREGSALTTAGAVARGSQ